MAFLKFNKAELVNRSYSLKREIIAANKAGAYCNTTIVCCNTRRYHGLYAVTLDRFGGDRYLLLSSLDESLVVDGKQFNLGIHCYGDQYFPKGHKYVVDFEADPLPRITYKVGEVVLRKSFLVVPDINQLMVKYELLQAPSKVSISFQPFLAFRNIHELTHENSEAQTSARKIQNGLAFRLYSSFPELCLQFSDKDVEFDPFPCWNKNITYSDEYRRGFDCTEDLFVPGFFKARMKEGSELIFYASMDEGQPSSFKKRFAACEKAQKGITSTHEQLVYWADRFVNDHNGYKRITAGFSWLFNGLLRETLQSIAGIELFGKNNPAEFEEILDNLIQAEPERLLRRTTQVEAPLRMAIALQDYIRYGADPAKVWKKYGPTLKSILESYLPGVRSEVAMHPNGLLWAQTYSVALSWMNAYISGSPVTERPGYQVETNAFWYNAICFALEMEQKYGAAKGKFVKTWTEIKDSIDSSFMPTFWDEGSCRLADYVDGYGRNMRTRPNQLLAIAVDYSPVPDEVVPLVLKVIDNELLTARGVRSLSPRDPDYKGVYEGSQVERDLAYHQGCAFPFLLDPYCRVAFRVKGPAFYKKAEWLTEGFFDDLSKHGVGAFSELYDGDPPQEPHGAIASALSTAALLMVEYTMKQYYCADASDSRMCNGK